MYTVSSWKKNLLSVLLYKHAETFKNMWEVLREAWAQLIVFLKILKCLIIIQLSMGNKFFLFLLQNNQHLATAIGKRISATFNKWRSIFIKIKSIRASWNIFSDFVANKIIADVGCMRMMMYNAFVWCRLRAYALWSYN